MPSEFSEFRLIVAMGVTGCGKSSIGGALAERLGIPFLDADDYHPPENIEKMSQGIPLNDEDRWPWLDRLGETLRGQAGRVILGCSALRRVYRERLIAGAGAPILFVHLSGTRELIAERLAERAGHYMPPELLDSQFATLEPPGSDEAVLTVDIAPPIADLVDELAGALTAPQSGTASSHMAIMGLGVMGANLALNMAGKGFTVTVYDPWAEARERFADGLDAASGATVRIAPSAGDLVAGMTGPRTVLVMVKAGAPVDDAIESLRPHLAPGDTVIDGGNSHFEDTVRREALLAEDGLHFIGLGISGGEEGARRGPSLMAGGSTAAYANSRSVLEAIAADFEGTPCCARVGGDGAGHFVKMVHNGIEYGLMQAIAETYVMLRDLAGLDHDAMAAVFRDWNAGALSSYLVEITATILARKDGQTGAPLVELVLDKAGQKGTGRWSSEAALAFGMPTPSITEAVFARALAAMKDARLAAAETIAGPPAAPQAWNGHSPVEALGQALLASSVAIYAQGFDLIQAAAKEREWDTDLATVAAIWRAGCVIRAGLLDDMTAAFRDGKATPNLLGAPRFADLIAENQAGWRQSVAAAALNGIPAPALGSALAYVDGLRTERGAANMIQAQRDVFGAHTYERIDKPGTFHTDWTK